MTALLNSYPSSSAEIVGGQFNVVPPAPADGQFLPLQQDAAGNLLVNVAVFSGSITATNPSVGLTGAIAPTSATEIGVVDSTGKLQHVTGLDLTNAFAVTVAIVDGSGNQITSFGGGAQFAMGSVQSASALGTIALGYDGTNVRGLLTSSTGQLHVIIDSATLGTVTVAGSVSVSNFPATQSVSQAAVSNPWIVAGAGTAGSPGTAVLTVQGISGGTAIPVSGTVSVTGFANPMPVVGTLTHNSAAPAATEIGVLPAIANVALPTFNEGDQVLLSTDLTGVLRVNGPYKNAVNQGPGTQLYGILALGLQGGTTPTAIQIGESGNIFTGPDGRTDQPGSFNSASVVGATGNIFSFGDFNEFASGTIVTVTTVPAGGTISGGSIIMEGADNNGNWLPVMAVFAGTQQIVTWPYAIQQQTVVQMAINLIGYDQVRVRLVTAIVGTGRVDFLSTIQSNNTPLQTVVVAGPVTLPTNAAQETGGNLATLVAQTGLGAKVTDVLNSILSQLKLLNLNIASSMPSAHVDADTYLLDTIPTFT